MAKRKGKGFYLRNVAKKVIVKTSMFILSRGGLSGGGELLSEAFIRLLKSSTPKTRMSTNLSRVPPLDTTGMKLSSSKPPRTGVCGTLISPWADIRGDVLLL